jgi:hypothetical protein
MASPPAEVPTEPPVDVPVPVEVPFEVPAGVPVDVPVDGSVEVPVDVPVEVPVAVGVPVVFELPVPVPGPAASFAEALDASEAPVPLGPTLAALRDGAALAAASWVLVLALSGVAGLPPLPHATMKTAASIASDSIADREGTDDVRSAGRPSGDGGSRDSPVALNRSDRRAFGCGMQGLRNPRSRRARSQRP